MNIDAGLLTNIALGLLAMSGAWIGAYVAIRSDLARLHERTAAGVDSAHKAHARIDDLIKGHGLERRRYDAP